MAKEDIEERDEKGAENNLEAEYQPGCDGTSDDKEQQGEEKKVRSKEDED